MIPIILSGGSGTRLWPVSRAKVPKQFCDIFEESLFTLTLKRSRLLGSPWVLTSNDFRDQTLTALRKENIFENQCIFEPQAKNTAPAIAYLTNFLAKSGYADEIVAVLPADHLIGDEELFRKAMSLAEIEAQKGSVVTLGVSPSYPETGYGYIETEDSCVSKEQGFQSFAVKKFHEKPNLELASEFVKSKNFHWNTGIFIFKIKVMAELFSQLQPEIWKITTGASLDHRNISEIYQQYRSISIDYAIMEKLKAPTLKCIPCDFSWNDVGSWDAIAKILDSNLSPIMKVEVKSHSNYIHPIKNKTYALTDVENLIIVDTKDALLISKKGSSQLVKDVVDKLKFLNPIVSQDHVFENRPWGKFEVLRDENHFKSKVIQILPKAQISYQSHTKREEHWIITKGAGEVILDDQTVKVSSGTYFKIPLGSKHRIKNTGDEILEFIEVQLGTYFGEDDIIRYQDDYKRN